MPETGVIIRTRNEEKWLGAVLQKLMEQDYKKFEIIIVDNESTDRTLEIARKFPARIISLPNSEFTYPHALNVGIEHSSATKYIAILSAHSIPYSSEWLSGSLKNFTNENVAGVYGPQLPLPGATIWDYFYLERWFWAFRLKGKREIIATPGMGVLGFTNAVIRKDLWEQHRFDESYAAGGEDGEWAGFWLSRGYVAVKDLACTVRHSHNLNLAAWKKQWQYWSSLGKPHPFKRLDYRKDGPHSAESDSASRGTAER